VRPFKSIFNNIIFVINEAIILFVTSTCILFTQQGLNEDISLYSGWVLLCLITVMIVLNSIYLWTVKVKEFGRVCKWMFKKKGPVEPKPRIKVQLKMDLSKNYVKIPPPPPPPGPEPQPFERNPGFSWLLLWAPEEMKKEHRPVDPWLERQMARRYAN
jgi:hypothetical protein